MVGANASRSGTGHAVLMDSAALSELPVPAYGRAALSGRSLGAVSALAGGLQDPPYTRPNAWRADPSVLSRNSQSELKVAAHFQPSDVALIRF